MPMEGWGKWLSPQNTFLVSGGNSVASKSNTIEITGDRFFNCKKKQQKKTIICLHTARVVSSKCREATTLTFDSKWGHSNQVFSLAKPRPLGQELMFSVCMCRWTQLQRRISQDITFFLLSLANQLVVAVYWEENVCYQLDSKQASWKVECWVWRYVDTRYVQYW